MARNEAEGESFLQVLKEAHPSLDFTMEMDKDNCLPFLGMLITKEGCALRTEIYRKPTDKGLLLHFRSHVDARYKKALLRTMLDRAFKLSSSWLYFTQEVDRLKEIFRKLQYPMNLFDSTVRALITQQQHQRELQQQQQQEKPQPKEDGNEVRFAIPFKDQPSSDAVKRQLKDLSSQIDIQLQPVFTSRKLGDYFGHKEQKLPIINQQNVVYQYECDLCEAGYVGYTCRHLFQRIDEHASSAVGKHHKKCHNNSLEGFEGLFSVLRRCKNKSECLVYEMLLIRDKRPKINIQSDSIKSKVF